MLCVSATSQFLGIYWGGRRVLARYRTLSADLAAIQEITRLGLDSQTSARRQSAIREPTSNWTTVEYVTEFVELAILRHAVEELRWPALLLGGGVILATIAGIIPLWSI